MQSILKKSTTSILLIFAISVCVFLDSDESLLLVPPKSELFTAVNYKIRSVAALSATSYLEQAKEVQLRNRHSPLFSTTTSGEDSGKKEGIKKPSLFKSLRIRSPVSSHNDDAATVQSKMDEKLTDQPKPARSKKQIPIAREISQDEDVSSNSKKAITPISKVAEENIVISELENITPKSKPTKRVKKQNNDNLENLESIISISSATPATTTTTTTTTAATGGDNELEFFLEEGSKYIAEHSVIMTPSELHKISSKNSGIKSNSAAGGKNRGKIELDETKMKEIQDLIERRFDHKYHREFNEVLSSFIRKTNIPSIIHTYIIINYLRITYQDFPICTDLSMNGLYLKSIRDAEFLLG